MPETKSGYIYPPLELLDLPYKPLPSEWRSRNEEALRRILTHFESEWFKVSIAEISHSYSEETEETSTRCSLFFGGRWCTDDTCEMLKACAKIEGLDDVNAFCEPDNRYVRVVFRNNTRHAAVLREILQSEAMAGKDLPVLAALGEDIFCAPVVLDIASMPSLLIAGDRRKEVRSCLQAMVCSIAMRASPKETKLVLVDAFKNEDKAFSLCGSLPHLLVPPAEQPVSAFASLAWVKSEMERRLKVLVAAGVHSIDQYNDSPASRAGKMSRLVVFLAELAALMLTDRKETEKLISCIAENGSAAGVHLVAATVRPIDAVMTPCIKESIPSRIAFEISSAKDMLAVFEENKACYRLNKNELILKTGASKWMRVKGCSVSEEEMQRVDEFFKESEQAAYGVDVLSLLEALEKECAGRVNYDAFCSILLSDESIDSVLAEAIDLAAKEGKISIRMLQRHFRRMGVSHAMRLMDKMEEFGLIGDGPERGTPKDVYISKERWAQIRAQFSI